MRAFVKWVLWRWKKACGVQSPPSSYQRTSVFWQRPVVDPFVVPQLAPLHIWLGHRVRMSRVDLALFALPAFVCLSFLWFLVVVTVCARLRSVAPPEISWERGFIQDLLG